MQKVSSKNLSKSLTFFLLYIILVLNTNYFYLQRVNVLNIKNTLTENLNPTIYVCAKAFHQKGWIENRYHPTFTLWLVTGGDVSINIEEKRYLLNKGDAYLFTPNIPYRATTTCENCEFIYIHFNLFTLNEQNLFNIFEFNPFISSATTKKYFDVFFSAFQDFDPTDGISFLALKGAFMLLISKIVQDNFFKFSAEKTSGIFSGKLQSLLEHIEENLSRKISIKELSSTLFMSEKYFIVYFKSIIGLTPHQYIVERRMKKAYDLLNQNGFSVSQTAEMVGYPDQYSFTKAFKSKYGFSPTRIKNTSHK